MNGFIAFHFSMIVLSDSLEALAISCFTFQIWLPSPPCVIADRSFDSDERTYALRFILRNVDILQLCLDLSFQQVHKSKNNLEQTSILSNSYDVRARPRFETIDE